MAVQSRLLYLIVIGSGIAGLGYQMVWSRMLSVSLGHEIVAVIAVVSAFFIGLTTGALALGRIIRESHYPHLWFVALEWVIAAWALALIALMPAYNQWMPQLIGAQPTMVRHWGMAFTGSFLLLLPATAAMGATLPAMERIMTTLCHKPDRVAALYACNTFGAVIGTLGATFYLLPQFGLTNTLVLLATINFICGGGVWLLCKRAALALPSISAVARLSAENDSPRFDASRLGITLFFTGLLGIGYEILVIRVLSQILENTVYTFAVVLSVYLMGTALGSSLYQRMWARQHMTEQQWQQRLDTLLIIVSATCLLGVFALWFGNTVYLGIWQGMGRGFLPALLAEFAAAALAFLIPTIAMGALFSHLAQRATHTIGLGRALGLNTLGAAIAPLIFGIAILPVTGAKVALLLIGVSYLLLTPGGLFKGRPWALLPAALAITLWLSPLQLRFVELLETERVVHHREGVMATLAVVEDNNQHRYLKVNNHFTMGGTASRYSDHRQTHIPMLLHGSARSVLYLGVGTGITLDAARYYPDTEVVGVELIPESLSLLEYFGVYPDAAHWHRPPQLLAADARRYVLSSQRQFDLIIGDIFHPARDGAAYLYTLEHFTAVKNRLTDDGTFCQWLPLFQLDLPSLKSIIRTFVQVFPNARLHLGHYSLQQPILCLEGAMHERMYPDNWLFERINDRSLQNELVQLRLNSDFALFGGYLGSGEALQQFAGQGPLNTDDHPLIAYQAPMLAYSDDEPAMLRLASLIQTLAGNRKSIVAQDAESRMQRYWQARDQFLLSAVALEQNSQEGWLEQLQSDLLDVVRISGDFEPAYYTLLTMAQEIYSRDPRASFQLLDDLHAASPAHPEALLLRHRLFP